MTTIPTASLAPLVATKHYIPRIRADVVRRPRLVAQIQQGLHCPLTVISAPAGFGKTTLLAEWYAAAGGVPGDNAPAYRLAWVALDEGDNDPVRFWRYVATALENVQPGAGRSVLPLLESPQALPFEIVLTTLINTLAADVAGTEFFLALDDYHVIEAPAIHSGMTFLLEHLPSHVHIIISSRVSPALPLARLRARGQLSEIRAADLRFTGDETPELLHRLLGESLSATSLSTLEKQTEGWAAGLQLAALSLRGSPDIPARVAAFGGANRLVLDYITEEVLRRQPAGVQRFLLHTSILDRMCASLCDAVTGDFDGQSMLETLESNNLFLVPLDGQQQWFRYHHLFAGLLRQRLQRTLPEAISQLHQRAARWLQQNGLLSDAVEHALAGEDFPLAALLIQSYFQTTLERSEMNTVRRWLDALPREIRTSSADLSLIYGWVLLATGAFGSIEPYLCDVEWALDLATPSGEEAVAHYHIVRGSLAALRATVAVNSGRKDLARELSLEALRVLPPANTLPRTVAALALADALWGQNDLPAATQAFIEAYQASLATGMIPVALNALANLGQLYERRGKLRQAAATYQQALQLPEAHSAFAQFSGKSHVGMARILREWGNLTEARAEAERGIECARAWGHQELLIDGYLCLANIQWVELDTDGALATLDEAEPLIFQRAPHPEAVARFTSYQASRWVLRGRLEDAHRWANRFDAGMQGDAKMHWPGIQTLARLRLAEGDPEAAFRLLVRLLSIVEQVGLTEDGIGIHILLALAHQGAHRSAQADRELRQALALAEPEGYRRIFLDEGAPLEALLESLVSGGAGSAYARSLLLYLRSSAASGESERLSPLAEPLTRRELEVLRLIAEGASNQEIAEALVIALGTVKKHITTIFAKVGVTSRTQLLARARDLGLLQL